MKLLFLDFDGVLNDHRKMRNKYSPLCKSCVSQLCRILRAHKDLRIVVSSAWRYMMFDRTYDHAPFSPERPINHEGMEYILVLFGAPYKTVHGRIHWSPTLSDELTCEVLGLAEEGAALDYGWLKEHGHLVRREQILGMAAHLKPSRFAVLDDLDLEMPELFLTDGKKGLTPEVADQVIAYLGATVEGTDAV